MSALQGKLWNSDKKIMSSSTWQDHFKAQLDGLASSMEGSLLEAALTEGKIKEEDYLAWASREHHLPLLSSQFFTDYEANPELLKKARLSWGPTLIPVNEWDDHLIIAGLELPQNLPENCSFVLASLQDLSAWWEQLAPIHQSLQSESPDGVSLDLPGEGELELPSFESASAPAPKLSFSGVSLVVNNSSSATEPTNPAKENINLSEKSIEPPLVATALSQNIAEPIPEEVTGPSSDITLDPPDENTPPPVGERSVSFVGSNISVVFKGNPTLEKNSVSELALDNPMYKHDLQKLVSPLASNYPFMMLLAFDAEKKNLIPLLWTENFQAPNPLSKIPLGSPGFFEIVHSTEKPYHGPVIRNETNDLFLKPWFEGKLPETLTLIPLIGQNKTYGIFLGIGPKESYDFAILRYLERAMNEQMKKWKYPQESAAA